MAALSQLSYGPNLLGNSSGEIEIIRPIDAESLVVVGTVEAELDLCSTDELLVGEEEAAVDFLTEAA